MGQLIPKADCKLNVNYFSVHLETTRFQVFGSLAQSKRPQFKSKKLEKLVE